MIKKATLLFMFIVFIITVFGCETVKGAFKGGIEGGSEGTRKDWEAAKNVGAALMRADEWIQENLW